MNMFALLAAIIIIAVEPIPGGHVAIVENTDTTQEYRVRASMKGAQNYTSPWYQGIGEQRMLLPIMTTDTPSTPTRIVVLSRPVDSTTTPTQTQADVVIQPSRDLVEVLPLYTYLDASAKSSVRPAVRAMMQAEYVAARQLLQEQYKRDITNLQAKYAVDPKADPYTQR